MLRLLIRYGFRVLLIVAPFFLPLMNLLGFVAEAGDAGTVRVHLGFTSFEGPASDVQLWLRISLVGLAIAGIFVFDIFDLYLPQLQRKDFRKQYLDLEAKKWKKHLGEQIRISVLYARRPWFFPLFRYFRWEWTYGFRAGETHHDANLFLTEWQGVAGRALRQEKPQLARIPRELFENLSWAERWLLLIEFRLWHWQLKKMHHVRAILSIPMLRQKKATQGNPKWQCVGVINVDAVEADGLSTLEDKSKREEITDLFIHYGKILAMLR